MSRIEKKLIVLRNISVQYMYMEFQIKKPNFLKGPAVKKTTLSLTQPMYDALEAVASKTNQSIPEIICDALEQFLTHLATEKEIPFPKK